MGRNLRLKLAGACSQVHSRGNDPRDRIIAGSAKSFLDWLNETCGRFGWRIHACASGISSLVQHIRTPAPAADALHSTFQT